MQGCGIKGFIPTSVIQANLPLYMGISLWEALFVVSQKWSPFPTTLVKWDVPFQDTSAHLLARPNGPSLHRARTSERIARGLRLGRSAGRQRGRSAGRQNGGWDRGKRVKEFGASLSPIGESSLYLPRFDLASPAQDGQQWLPGDNTSCTRHSRGGFYLVVAKQA